MFILKYEKEKITNFIFVYQTSMSVKVLHVSMGTVLTISICTDVTVNLALQVLNVIQVCTHSVNVSSVLN